MTAGTYEIRNKLDGMPYGGSSGNIEGRRTEHRWMLRNDRHHCAHLQNAWNKYGKDAFEFIILEEIEDDDERLAAEQAWLDVHWPDCYNSAPCATSTLGYEWTDEQKEAQRLWWTDERREAASISMMGKQYGLGCKHTDEQNRAKGERSKLWWTDEKKEAKSERMMGNQNGLGHKHTDARKAATSERMMGKQMGLGSTHTDEWKLAQSERMKLWWTDERKEALGERQMGRTVSAATRQKISDGLAGNQNALGCKHTEEMNRAHSQIMKLYWAERKAAEAKEKATEGDNE